MVSSTLYGFWIGFSAMILVVPHGCKMAAKGRHIRKHPSQEEREAEISLPLFIKVEKLSQEPSSHSFIFHWPKVNGSEDGSSSKEE